MGLTWATKRKLQLLTQFPIMSVHRSSTFEIKWSSSTFKIQPQNNMTSVSCESFPREFQKGINDKQLHLEKKRGITGSCSILDMSCGLTIIVVSNN